MLPLKVAGLGLYYPERKETTEDFLKQGVPQKLIDKLGIYERRLIGDNQSVTDMEIEASKLALKNAAIEAEEIDFILSATTLPEMIGIPNSNLIQDRLNATNAAAIDIRQACGSVIPGMIIAGNFLALGQYKKILLTVSTNWSVIGDKEQASANYVLGDGAAAMVLTPSSNGYGIISFDMETTGKFYHHCGVRTGHDNETKYYERHDKKLLFFIDNDAIENTSSSFNRYLLTNGPSTFKTSLKKAQLTPENIDCAFIHANIKPITKGWIKGMKVEKKKFPLTFDRYGNLNVVTILANLQEGLDNKMFKKGDTVAFVSQGAGFTAGSIIMRWE